MVSCPAGDRPIGLDMAVPEPPEDDGGYEIELPSGSDEDIPIEWQRGAVYTLELAARCPHCLVSIQTIRVLKLKRTQAAFTSALPRNGRVIVCPECDRILSVEL